MKYKNTKSKLHKIYNDSFSNESQAINTKESIIKTKKEVEEISNSIHLFNKIHSYSTKWESMETLAIDTLTWSGGSYVDSQIYVLNKNWRIKLPNFPINLLSFVDLKILLESFQHTIDYNKVRIGKAVEVKNVKDGIVISPEIVAGVNYMNLAQYYTIKARLVIKVYNPEMVF